MLKYRSNIIIALCYNSIIYTINLNFEVKPLFLNTSIWKVIRFVDVQIHARLTPVNKWP